jgi:hypothetical protein
MQTNPTMLLITAGPSFSLPLRQHLEELQCRTVSDDHLAAVPVQTLGRASAPK